MCLLDLWLNSLWSRLGPNPTCFPRQSSGADDVDSEKGVEAEVNGDEVK